MAGSGLRSLTSRLDHRRRTILVLLVMAAVVLAAGGGAAPDATTWTGLPGREALAIVLQVALGVGLLAIVAALVVLRNPRQQAPRRRGSWQLLVMLMLIVALTSFLPRNEGELAQPEPEEAVAEETPRPAETERAEGLSGADLVVLLGILAGGLAVLWWIRRGEPDPDLSRDDDLEVGLAPAVERASEHLFVATDPRAAVMVAYRELEQTLERLDLARAPTETPSEHLARALDALAVEDPAEVRPLNDLADLYQAARFSEHAITADDQRRAAQSLRQAADSLRRAAGSPRRAAGSTAEAPVRLPGSPP